MIEYTTQREYEEEARKLKFRKQNYINNIIAKRAKKKYVNKKSKS